ncbi:MAG: NAD(P)H-binding protein, partial [Neisseriaceae bacterium]|nr:NAD(P)H-binding protein [Neisseriaceae bacterium]
MNRRNFFQSALFAGISLLTINAFAQDKKMKVLILGATGSLGKYVIDALLHKNPNIELILYARNSGRLKNYATHSQIKIIDGDVLDTNKLTQALQGVNAVYAGLAGDLSNMAKSLITAMNAAQVKRLVWISSYGIYNEIGNGTMPPAEYVHSAKIIEQSNLEYTIIRPQWFSS